MSQPWVFALGEVCGKDISQKIEPHPFAKWIYSIVYAGILQARKTMHLLAIFVYRAFFLDVLDKNGWLKPDLNQFLNVC